MKNSEILSAIRGETRVHIWDRQTGKTTTIIEMLREDPFAWVLVPTMRQVALYPPDIRRRVRSSGQQNNGIIPRNSRLILDDVDVMPVTDSIFLDYYRNYHITDLFLSPRNFVDYIIMNGTVDVRSNEEYREHVKQMAGYPWA